MDWPPGTHSNTFGGNLLASAASLAALNFMEREDIGTLAKQWGDHFMLRLREMQSKYPDIGDVRGLGLMIGVEIVKPDGSIDQDPGTGMWLKGSRRVSYCCHVAIRPYVFTASCHNKGGGGYGSGHVRSGG